MTTYARSPSLLLAIAAGALAGCGAASGPARPRPLQHHLEERHLAAVADKKDVEAARALFRRAVADNRKAESDQASSQRALDDARREAGRAAEQLEAADRAKSQAEESKDWQLQNKVTRDQRIAEVTLQAAERKVTMMEARRDWLDAWVAYTRENLFAVEARFELAKANLARAHNIAPPDFAYQAFVDQADRRRARAAKLKPPADDAERTWLAARKEWEAKRRDEMEARGLDTDTAAAAKADTDDGQ